MLRCDEAPGIHMENRMVIQLRGLTINRRVMMQI